MLTAMVESVVKWLSRVGVEGIRWAKACVAGVVRVQETGGGRGGGEREKGCGIWDPGEGAALRAGDRL